MTAYRLFIYAWQRKKEQEIDLLYTPLFYPQLQLWFWSSLGVTLTVGASQVTYKGRFNPKKFLELMEKYRVNKLCSTPTEYRMWAQEDLEAYDLSDMKKFLSTGEIEFVNELLKTISGKIRRVELRERERKRKRM